MTRIHLENVCVDFPLFNTSRRPFGITFLDKTVGALLTGLSGKKSKVRALDQISIRLQKGDKLGLIGHNGSGKTTLLRVMAGVYPPTDGRIRCEGRIAALLDISLGFDLEASGYDNIRLRALFLGLSKSQIESRMGKIAEFSGLGPYLTLQIRTYSSGMLMRLAFAIATETEPDIILMDEWIGVGDAKFLKQAKDRLEGFIGSSSILVLASHSEELIRSTCNKAILLAQGQILAEGSVDDVFHHYNFFGASHFFDMEEYISLYPDIKNVMALPGTAPWMHFVRYGIFEGRSPGCGIVLKAFENDPTFQRALSAGDGLAAAERIEEIAPFLISFKPPKDWRGVAHLKYPDSFVQSRAYPILSRKDAEKLYPIIK